MSASYSRDRVRFWAFLIGMALLSALLVIGLAYFAARQRAARVPRLAFVSAQCPGETGLYAVNVDGSGFRRLALTPALGSRPVWSPDGTRLAFLRGDPALAISYGVMAIDSPDEIHPAPAVFGGPLGPLWSPDGTRVAFVGDTDGDQIQEIYTLRLDGSERTQVAGFAADFVSPVWSPDGTRLAIAAGSGGANHIHIVNADGSGLLQLTPAPADYTRLIWSPDSTRLLSSPFYTDTFILFNADGSGMRTLPQVPPGSTGVDPVWSPDGTRIAITSNTDSNGGANEIEVFNVDGSGSVRLTQDSAGDGDPPAWSPDGTRLLFVSDGDRHLYRIDADGTGLTPLAPGLTLHNAPLWSPDGRRIAFLTAPDRAIYRLNADGSGLTRLTHNAYSDRILGWSADGSRLAYVANRNGRQYLSVANTDGSNEARWVQPISPYTLTWLAAGTRAAFAAPGRHAHGSELFVVGSDGSGETRLTQNAAPGLAPAWSPDGEHVAFVAHATQSIHIVRIDGTGETRLTQAESTQPAWSPDGARIAFVQDQNIFVVNLDGSDLRQLTHSFDDDTAPAWSPDGRRIVFLRDAIGDPAIAPDLYSVNLDGSGETRLTQGEHVTEILGWLPGQDRIVFVAQRNPGFSAVNADGTGLQPLQQMGGTFFSLPSWSPDRTWVSYQLHVPRSLSSSFSWKVDGGLDPQRLPIPPCP